jgi:hypothetical protein
VKELRDSEEHGCEIFFIVGFISLSYLIGSITSPNYVTDRALNEMKENEPIRIIVIPISEMPPMTLPEFHIRANLEVQVIEKEKPLDQWADELRESLGEDSGWLTPVVKLPASARRTLHETLSRKNWKVETVDSAMSPKKEVKALIITMKPERVSSHRVGYLWFLWWTVKPSVEYRPSLITIKISEDELIDGN